MIFVARLIDWIDNSSETIKGTVVSDNLESADTGMALEKSLVEKGEKCIVKKAKGLVDYDSSSSDSEGSDIEQNGNDLEVNQTPNEQNISLENQAQSLVTNESVASGSQKSICCNDLVYVLSVMEKDMGILEISAGTNDCLQLLENDQKKKKTLTDESDSCGENSSASWILSDSDSDSKDDEIIELSVTTSEQTKVRNSHHDRTPKTKGEITLADLPKVAPIDLCVDESVELSPLGEIESILSKEALVIIKSFEQVPALDVDSILFLENRSGLGTVFEIFGQVKCPHYCVRFNNENEIKSTNIEVGQTVYFAPDTKDLTNFVFVSKLNSVKGSDASWKHDQEPPEEIYQLFYRNWKKGLLSRWAARDTANMSNVDASLKKVGANTKKQTSLDRADKFKKYKKKHTPNNKFLEYSDDEAESKAKAERKRAGQMKKRNEAHMQEEGMIESNKKQKQFNPLVKKRQTKRNHTNQQGGRVNTLSSQQLGEPATTPHQQIGPPPQQSQGVPRPNPQHPPLGILPPPLRPPLQLRHHVTPTTTPHQQLRMFVPPLHVQQSQGVPRANEQHPPLGILPPPLRPPLQIRTSLQSPLPRSDNGHQPFSPPPPLGGRLLPQPNLPYQPGFYNEPSNAPPPTYSTGPWGIPSHQPHPHFETPTHGGQPFRPWQTDPRFRPPIPQCSIVEKSFANSSTAFSWPTPPQNVGNGLQRLAPQTWMPRSSAVPSRPTTNHWTTEHALQQPTIRQAPPADVQQYLDM